MNLFIDYIKELIRLIIVNRLCFIAVKLIKKIKNSFYSLFFYSLNWLFNRVVLRQIVQRFNENIADYRKSFVSFRFRQSNFNNALFFELIVSRSNRFWFQSLIAINCAFFSIIFISNSFFTFSFSLIIKRVFSTLKFFVFRITLMLIFSIKSTDNN